MLRIDTFGTDKYNIVIRFEGDQDIDVSSEHEYFNNVIQMRCQTRHVVDLTESKLSLKMVRTISSIRVNKSPKRDTQKAKKP